MLRNPRSSKLSTTLDPTKPVAPVTRMRSSRPMMKSSRSTWLTIPPLVGDIGSFHRTDSKECQKLAEVVEKLDRVGHESSLPQNQRKRQNGYVGGNSYDRFRNVEHSKGWV